MIKKLPFYFFLVFITTQVYATVYTNEPLKGNFAQISTPNWDAKIYRNPNNGTFTIMIIDNAAAINIVVFNVIGEKVFEMTALGDHGAKIDLSNLQKGLYVVQLLDKVHGEMITRRMQVK